MSEKLNYKRIFITAVLIIVTVQIFYVAAFPKLINLPEKIPFIESIFRQRTDLSLTIENPKLKTYPDFSISLGADFIGIHEKNGIPVFISDTPFFKIQPLKLIFKELRIKEISTGDIYLNISRFKDATVGFKNFNSGDFKLPLKIEFSGATIISGNYNILFKDDCLNRFINLKGSGFRILPRGKHFSGETSGILNVDGNVSRYRIRLNSNKFNKNLFKSRDYTADGEINNIDAEAFEPYLIAYTGCKSAKGKLNFKFKISDTKALNTSRKNLSISATAENLAINKGEHEREIVSPGLTRVDFKGYIDKNSVSAEQLIIKGENIAVTIKGTVKDYADKHPQPDITAEISNSEAKNILGLIPPGIDVMIDKIKKYGISGNVNAKFEVKGKIPDSIEIFGFAEAQNVHALRGIENTHTGRIKLKFNGQAINTDVEIDIHKNQKFHLTGISHIYEDEINRFVISTSDKLDLPLVRKLLVPISDVFKFETGPLPLLTLTKGTGNAVMEIEGNSKFAFINGKINISDAAGTMSGLSAKLSDINLIIDFNKDIINFITSKAFIDSAPFTLNGNSDIKGAFGLIIASDNINSSILRNILINSDWTKDIHKDIATVEKIAGKSKIGMSISAKTDTTKLSNSPDILTDLKISGEAELYNNNCKLTGFDTNLTKVNTKFRFSESEIDFEKLIVNIGNSFYTLSGKLSSVPADTDNGRIKISAHNADLNDTLNFILKSDTARKIGIKTAMIPELNTQHDINFICKFRNNLIDLKTIAADIKLRSGKNAENPIHISSGNINISKNNAEISGLILQTGTGNLKFNGKVNGIATAKPYYDIYLTTKSLAAADIANMAHSGLFSKTAAEIFDSCKNYTGNTDINVRLTPRGASGDIRIKNLTFRHKSSDIPFSFPEGKIKLTKDKIFLSKITGTIGRTGKIPVFIDASIGNYMKLPYINGSFATQLIPVFVERYINTKLQHPVKTAGDIGITADISGSLDSLRINSAVKLNKDSDITYLASNIGDIESYRELTADMILRPKNLILNKFEYIKYPTAQNNKRFSMPMFTAKGKFVFSKSGIIPEVFAFSTYRANPAKMLNILFKKSLIKSGTFNCSVGFENNLKTGVRKASGIFNLSGIEIPLYGWSIKQSDIKADNGLIKIVSEGKLINTDYNIKASAVNSLTLPLKIKNININAKQTDLEKIIERVNQMSIDAYTNKVLQTDIKFDISDIIIDKGRFTADRVAFKSIPSDNIKAFFSLSDKGLLNIKTEKFKTAGGTVRGEVIYNFKNGETKGLLNAEGVDADASAKSFFDLDNQITGHLDGNIKIATSGFTQKERTKNLNGKVTFGIQEGNMPKLGSLEYLLRASNLFRSGLTTLSVNSIIELLNPVRKGAFSHITGGFDITNGIMKNINIHSAGQNLSIYIKGSYDIAEYNADITVFGKFGRKIDGLFGPIGNLSVNTLLNLIPLAKESNEYKTDISKIPDIEYKNHDSKIFRAKVDGNINENNFVSSFKWIK